MVQIVAQEPLGTILAQELGGETYMPGEATSGPLLIYAHYRRENWFSSQHGGLRRLERILADSQTSLRVLIIGFLREDHYGELSYLLNRDNYVRLPVSGLPRPLQFPVVPDEVCSNAKERQARSAQSQDCARVIHTLNHELDIVEHKSVRKKILLERLLDTRRHVRCISVRLLVDDLIREMKGADVREAPEILERHRRKVRCLREGA